MRACAIQAREQEARERLMAHVMEERRFQIDEKAARLQQEKEEELYERQKLLEDLERGAGERISWAVAPGIDDERAVPSE